jgi:tetratricopeptide (TPR) repeat protein
MKAKLLLLLILLPTLCFADSLTDTLNSIESEWASIYYGLPRAKQPAAYPVLLDKTEQLITQYPNDARVIYWHALIKVASADYKNPVAALHTIHEVRDLLTKAIAINPQVMNGAAYVVLGTLYDKVPPWPIGFGNDNTAKSMLETALKINPNGIASNYFYGQFLSRHDNIPAAKVYFDKALAAPIRPNQVYADQQMKLKVEHALKKMLAAN